MNEKSKTSSQSDPQAGLEEILEDFLGLNIRSVKSIWTLLIRPAEYFKAAKSPDWTGWKYTPSPRLWLGLIAILVALRIFWGGSNSQLIQQFADQAQAGFETGVNSNPDVQIPEGALAEIDWTATVNKTFDVMFVIQPILFILIFALLALIMRYWGERLSYYTRLRYLFGIVITATAFNLITTLLLPLLPQSFAPFVSLLQVLALLGLYFWTSYAGALHAVIGARRVWLALATSVILMIVVMLISMIAMIISMAFVMFPEVQSAIESAKALSGT